MPAASKMPLVVRAVLRSSVRPISNDQISRRANTRDERLFEIARSPHIERPLTIAEIEPFEAKALRLQRLADFLGLLLEQVQHLAVSVLHHGRRPAQRFARSIEPSCVSRLPSSVMMSFAAAVPNRDIQRAVSRKAVSRRADLFEFARFHATRGCERRRRLVHGLDLAGRFRWRHSTTVCRRQQYRASS